MISSLAPKDENVVKDEIAEKYGISPATIKNIRVVNWITGEILVSFHHSSYLLTYHMTSASENPSPL